MPSEEGRQSRHSEAYLPLLSPPGLDTISDDCGPAGAAGGWTSQPPPGPARLAGAVRRLGQMADEGRCDTALRD
jgi:hypothetical protein